MRLKNLYPHLQVFGVHGVASVGNSWLLSPGRLHEAETYER